MPRIRNPIRRIQAAISSPSLPQITIQPKLPPELEELIFLLAWQSGFENIMDMMDLLLVARRVHDWLCPVVFKVVLVTPFRPHPFPFTQPSFVCYGKHIRHLAIDCHVLRYRYKHNPLLWNLTGHGSVVSQVLFQVFKDCPNLVNLWLDNYELTDTKNLVRALSPLPLTRLAISLPLLMAQLGDAASSLPAFPRITHLQVLGAPFKSTLDQQKQAHMLTTHFPNLTHLALQAVDSYRLKTAIRLTLERCQHLQMLVWWHSRSGIMSARPPLNDVRIVNVYCGDVYVWKGGATGMGEWGAEGKDIWELGSEKEKREEEIKKLIESRELRWLDPYLG